jgi:hypothetical protein
MTVVSELTSQFGVAAACQALAVPRSSFYRSRQAISPEEVSQSYRLNGKARLLMELSDNNYANHQVILQTVEGREILRRRTGKVRISKDRAFATLPVEARELTRGDYILILFGQTAEGKSEEIAQYFFRVV